MSIEERAESIMLCLNNVCNTGYTLQKCDYDFIDKQIDEIKKEAIDVQPVDRWIDAQKNPPPIVDRRSMTSDSVLIQRDNGRCAVAYYCYDDEDGNCWVTDDEKTIYYLEEVTYWQPLPESLNGGDTNE